MRFKPRKKQTVVDPKNMNTWTVNMLLNKCYEMGITPPATLTKPGLVFAILTHKNDN